MRAPILTLLLLLSCVAVTETEAKDWWNAITGKVGKIVDVVKQVVDFMKTIDFGRRKRATDGMSETDLKTMCEDFGVNSLSGVTMDVLSEAFNDCDTAPKDGKLHGQEMKVFEESVGFIAKCLE